MVKYNRKYKKDNQIIFKILIGNKYDYETKREITFKEAKELADEKGMKYFETSAKRNINAKEFFLEIIKDLINIYEQQNII